MNARRKFKMNPDSFEVATVEKVEPIDDDIEGFEYLSFDKDEYDPLDERWIGFEELDFENGGGEMSDPIEIAVQAFFNQGRKATSGDRMKCAIKAYHEADASRVMSSDQFSLQCATLDLKDAQILHAEFARHIRDVASYALLGSNTPEDYRFICRDIIDICDAELAKESV